jgi:hypothetical protein
MANPVYALIEKYAGPRFARDAAGILADFWKDTPCEFPVWELKIGGHSLRIPNLLKPQPLAAVPLNTVAPMSRAEPKKSADLGPWHAQPGELAEKMWGEEQILPAGDALMTMLVSGLNLGRDKNVIDLTAGLGGPLRKLATQVNQVKGLEANPAIAARGMAISTKLGKAKTAPIEAYDPANFSMPAIYDCMIAREIFYRTPDRPKFLYNIAAGIKTHGHVVFTDYIVDPEHRVQPSIVAWQAHETAAKPLGLIEMAEAWAKVGFELKTSEDQTAFYRKEIANGVNRFVGALRAAPAADAETKAGILTEVGFWLHRLGAIQQGMKFYRFDAVKS